MSSLNAANIDLPPTKQMANLNNTSRLPQITYEVQLTSTAMSMSYQVPWMFLLFVFAFPLNAVIVVELLFSRVIATAVQQKTYLTDTHYPGHRERRARQEKQQQQQQAEEENYDPDDEAQMQNQRGGAGRKKHGAYVAALDFHQARPLSVIQLICVHVCLVNLLLVCVYMPLYVLLHYSRGHQQLFCAHMDRLMVALDCTKLTLTCVFCVKLLSMTGMSVIGGFDGQQKRQPSDIGGLVYRNRYHGFSPDVFVRRCLFGWLSATVSSLLGGWRKDFSANSLLLSTATYHGIRHEEFTRETVVTLCIGLLHAVNWAALHMHILFGNRVPESQPSVAVTHIALSHCTQRASPAASASSYAVNRGWRLQHVHWFEWCLALVNLAQVAFSLVCLGRLLHVINKVVACRPPQQPPTPPLGTMRAEEQSMEESNRRGSAVGQMASGVNVEFYRVLSTTKLTMLLLLLCWVPKCLLHFAKLLHIPVSAWMTTLVVHLAFFQSVLEPVIFFYGIRSLRVQFAEMYSCRWGRSPLELSRHTRRSLRRSTKKSVLKRAASNRQPKAPTPPQPDQGSAHQQKDQSQQPSPQAQQHPATSQRRWHRVVTIVMALKAGSGTTGAADGPQAGDDQSSFTDFSDTSTTWHSVVHRRKPARSSFMLSVGQL